MTNIIGSSEANAINPKPSIIGLRPLMAEAKPTPNAVTNGTVMVDVVTPPESYAMPMIFSGAKALSFVALLNQPKPAQTSLNQAKPS